MMNMSSPQWKSYQPPVQDPAILAFQRAPAPTQSIASTNLNNLNTLNNIIRSPGPVPASPLATSPLATSPLATTNNSIRETGIIDKLQHSYGFIQCCERDARLFFHFSEYGGNLDTMAVGENVEFQMSFDRRTGKPIAVSVVKIAAGSATFEVVNDKRVHGTVVVEAKPPKTKVGSPGNPLMQEGIGRVSYEECGEHFFIPYSIEDVENGTRIRQGDEVSFLVSTNKRNGSVRGIQMKLISAAEPERCQGVLCSMKDGYGFIERADVVKEIFFHYSEYQGDIETAVLGEDVEFTVQTRNGKDVAVDIHRLVEGTVIFEDVGVERRRGRIIKTLKSSRGRKSSDPLAGRIVYETVQGSIEIPYGDKDQKGDYTLQTGDLVDFNIATDRRDKLHRATNIQLVTETFKVSGETRETGIICSVKDGFGFIRCVDREARMFFHFSEMMDPEKDIQNNQEVQFTVIQDPTSPSRQIAVRILYLPKGTISLETTLPEKHIGTVEKIPVVNKSPSKNKDKEPDPGIIMYDVNGTKQTIPFSISAITGNPPKNSDKVEFQICESRKNNTRTAVNVKAIVPPAAQLRSPLKAQPANIATPSGSTKAAGQQQGAATKNASNATEAALPMLKGFIATLKDSFGFIETQQHDKEVFFHFSNFEGEPGELDLGDEVEYSLAKKTNKVSAEAIRKLPKGTVAPEDLQPGTFDGKVLRSLRIINPDQDEYPGLVQVTAGDGSEGEKLPYGITSLADKRDFLQTGDIVKFNVAVIRGTNKKRATNIAAVRKYIRAKVDSVKGQFGFLSYEAEPGKKLFFHMTEVHDKGVEIQGGDEVEFVVVQNQRNNKYSAVSLRKITDKRRPERLMSRLKSVADDSGPRMTTTRQPRGPDGTRGFAQPRAPWVPVTA